VQVFLKKSVEGFFRQRRFEAQTVHFQKEFSMTGTDHITRQLAFYDGHAQTHSKSSSDAFARSSVDAIIASLPHATGWAMRLDAATPPYPENVSVPAGHFEITLFTTQGDEYPIGLVFGAQDDAGRVLRQPFDAKAWSSNPGCSWSSELMAFNFDEAWRIVVLLAQRLQISSLDICYGLGM
jgi:hypothetical protein